jgi:outer membrane lipoprotein-sorting protein
MRIGTANSRRLALLLTTAASVLATAADAPLKPVSDPGPVLKDLHGKMSSLDSVYFEFTQERQLKLFSEPLKSEGVMLIARPDQIRWETTSPFQSILMGNHESVAQFEKEDGQWKKLNLGFPQMLRRVMEQMSLMHQGKMDALTSDFSVSVATGAVTVVTLTPKDQSVRSVLSTLEIHMPPDLSTTREVVMNEPNGDLTRIIFREEHRDVKLPSGTFDQNKPIDVGIIKKAVGRSP